MPAQLSQPQSSPGPGLRSPGSPAGPAGGCSRFSPLAQPEGLSFYLFHILGFCKKRKKKKTVSMLIRLPCSVRRNQYPQCGKPWRPCKRSCRPMMMSRAVEPASCWAPVLPSGPLLAAGAVVSIPTLCVSCRKVGRDQNPWHYMTYVPVHRNLRHLGCGPCAHFPSEE